MVARVVVGRAGLDDDDVVAAVDRAFPFDLEHRTGLDFLGRRYAGLDRLELDLVGGQGCVGFAVHVAQLVGAERVGHLNFDAVFALDAAAGTTRMARCALGRPGLDDHDGVVFVLGAVPADLDGGAGRGIVRGVDFRLGTGLNDLIQGGAELVAGLGREQLPAGLLGYAGQALHRFFVQRKADHVGADVDAFFGHFSSQGAGVAVAVFQAVGDQDDVDRFGGARNHVARQRHGIGQRCHTLRVEFADRARDLAAVVVVQRQDGLDIFTVAAPVVAVGDQSERHARIAAGGEFVDHVPGDLDARAVVFEALPHRTRGVEHHDADPIAGQRRRAHSERGHRECGGQGERSCFGLHCNSSQI